MINSLDGNLKQLLLGRSISDSNVSNIDGIKISSIDESTLLGATTDNKRLTIILNNHFAEKHHENFTPYAL